MLFGYESEPQVSKHITLVTKDVTNQVPKGNRGGKNTAAAAPDTSWNACSASKPIKKSCKKMYVKVKVGRKKKCQNQLKNLLQKTKLN